MEGRVPAFRSRVGKKRSPSPWAFGFIFLFFMGTLLVLFLRSPLSEIERIEITGHHLVSEREILTKTRFAKGISYFRISSASAEQALETLPEIKKAEVKKVFPNKVYIHVQEKPLIAFLRAKDQQLYPILADGSTLVHRPITVKTPGKPTFEGWMLPNSTFELAVKQISALPAAIQREMEIVKPVSEHPDQVEIWSTRHHLIYVRASDLTKKMSYYPSFQRHPRGTLYLLESIWFSPESQTIANDDL